MFEFEFTARCDGWSLSVGLQLSGKEIGQGHGAGSNGGEEHDTSPDFGF